MNKNTKLKKMVKGKSEIGGSWDNNPEGNKKAGFGRVEVHTSGGPSLEGWEAGSKPNFSDKKYGPVRHTYAPSKTSAAPKAVKGPAPQAMEKAKGVPFKSGTFSPPGSTNKPIKPKTLPSARDIPKMLLKRKRTKMTLY